MNRVWIVVMMISGGLFVGGVLSLAWERVPVWRRASLEDFRSAFAQTLRRVDRIQPALLAICLAATIGFAVTSGGPARTLAVIAAAGFLMILVGSVAWLVPIQRTIKSRSNLPAIDVEGLRSRWVSGHVIRTVLSVALFVMAVIATVA